MIICVGKLPAVNAGGNEDTTNLASMSESGDAEPIIQQMGGPTLFRSQEHLGPITTRLQSSGPYASSLRTFFPNPILPPRVALWAQPAWLGRVIRSLAWQMSID